MTAVSAYCEAVTVLPSTSRVATGWPLISEVVFPALAVAAIVGYAEIRSPLGLPGHRGLVWLTLLVAVTLTARRRETVLAVGATSTAATLMLHISDPWASGRYLAAAALLAALTATPVVHRRWLVALLAAPVHLVALAGSVAALLGGGHFATTSVGMPEKALFHLGFGLAAGLLGWAVASGMDRTLT